MNRHEDAPDTVLVTLSQFEGQRLFAFLSELVESGDPKTDFSVLDELLDKVGDANALALWLRENVYVELEGREVAKVREVLKNRSPEKCVASQADTVLLGIQGKLAEYLPGGTTLQR